MLVGYIPHFLEQPPILPTPPFLWENSEAPPSFLGISQKLNPLPFKKGEVQQRQFNQMIRKSK